jgi:hypothetical protein
VTDIFSDPHGSYPFDLVGADADRPAPPPPRLIAMAKRAAERDRDDTPPVKLWGTGWRLAHSIESLFTEADAANPERDHRSDGHIGDKAHAALGEATDHNPWLVHMGRGIVRAADLDADGLDLATAFERARQLAHAGRLPQLLGAGYLIFNGRITKPDYSGWSIYIGNPHVEHGHISVSRDPGRFDTRAPWGIFTTTPAPPPRPSPAAQRTGRDLTGRGRALRGSQGDSGPRVGQLQAFLNRSYPAYSRLEVDREWGPRTSAVIREFAHRSRIPEADGLNIGPRIAAALFAAGFDRTAAQARVLGHVRRAARR